MSEGERRLAAIMFTDIVGYTALTQSNESQAMEVLERHNRLLSPFFPRFHGREVKTIGDSFLVEFESALEALRCAAEIQSYLHDYNVSSKEEWKIKLRIGIHLGDVIHQRGDVFGDAVNIASRIQPIAEPEGICVSQQVYDQIQNKFDIPLVSLGERSLKNVTKPLELYAVEMPWKQSVSPKQTIPLPRHRIAVLPFANMSPDPNDSYFADGITEEIISTVSGISGLSVISRTSVMGYKGTTKKVEEIGKELKAGSVLEGSFRKAGNKIRITAQLIDVAGDKHLWAQNYDRDLDDVFAIQSDVAKQVAEALRVKILSPEVERLEKKPTGSTAAYTLYLKGRYLWNKRGVEEVKKAMEYFGLSVEEDPNFALGYVGLGDCHRILGTTWGIERESNAGKARLRLEKALELNPGLAEAHASKGGALMADFKLREAEEEFMKAIELKPSYALVHLWYFLLLLAQLRFDEALHQIEIAVELDPLSSHMNLENGFFYEVRRDYGRALQLAIRAIELDPHYYLAHGACARLYARLKMPDASKQELVQYAELVKNTFPLVGMSIEVRKACYLDEDKERVRSLLPDLEAHYTEAGDEALDMAEFHLFLGELDKGFEWMERSYSNREWFILFIQNFEFLDSVRTDPRYLSFLERLGLK